MILKSKFHSKCTICQKPISIGEIIEWEPGEKSRHRKCSRPNSLWAEEIEAAVDGLRESKNSMSRIVKKETEKVYTEAYIRKMFGKR